jgi:hypothetical protein
MCMCFFGDMQVSSTFTGGGNEGNNSAAVRSAVNAAAYSKRKATDMPAELAIKTARLHADAEYGGSSRRSAAKQNVAANSQHRSTSATGKGGEQRRISDLFNRQKAT